MSETGEPGSKGKRRRSLVLRAMVSAVLLTCAAVALPLVLVNWLPSLMAAALSLVLLLPLALLLARANWEPLLSIFRALAGTVASYRDGDYSFGLRWDRNDEMRDLVDAHNALGDVLRSQRLNLVQRELLLDTMVQNTPVAMLLVSDGSPVVFANLAARQMLNQGRKLEGMSLQQVLDQAQPALREAVARGGDGLFTVSADEEEEVYHLARRVFHLNGRAHELLLLRLLTTELRRQEVQTWKKVIRVISHELNNSLAPIASLAGSAGELLRRGQHEKLDVIMQTIGERARHLESFIVGYARFAKLPAPRLQAVAWPGFVARLAAQFPQAQMQVEPMPELARIDPAQMEQALINLLRNAGESGSVAGEVTLSLTSQPGQFRIEVADRGSGMSETVLTNALIPFYSTKRSGTGLGLALTREIVEAHGGRITLSNREGGGLLVCVVLPMRAGEAAAG